MASMLRSLRFIRRLNTDGRRLGVSALNRVTPPTNSTLAQNTALRSNLRCSAACFNQHRNYVTNAAVKQSFNTSSNVDEMLRELDRKTKQYGFVFKNDLEELINSVTVRGTLTSTQALLMIRCCGYFMVRETIQTRQEFVNKIWDIAKSLKVPLDVSHYNALLLVYLDNETDFSPLEILVEMKENNIAPNRVTFQRLIEQYCNKGDIAGATKILEHMSEHEVPLNESIFNSLILGHSMADDISSALKILDIMKQANVEPTSRTYTAIMCAHARKGDLESLQSVLLESQKNDITFSDKDILDVIYTLAINKHYNLVDEMISNIEKGVNYNRNALIVMCKLLDKNEADVAYKLQKSLIKTNNYQDENLNTADGILFLKKLILYNNDADTVTKYCNLMVKDEISLKAFENALYISYTNNFHHLALPLLKAMKQSDCEVRENYFYPIFVDYAKKNNLQGILNTLKTMLTEFNISPLIVTVKDYILPYMIESPRNNLVTLMDHNLSFHVASNAILFNCLENNKTRQAVNFLRNTKMSCKLNLMEKALVNSFLSTKAVDDFINILHYDVCSISEKLNEQNEDENSNNEPWRSKDPYRCLNTAICDAVSGLNSYDVETISNILQGLLKKGLNIKETTANYIKQHLGKNITSEIEETLTQLTSSNLELKPFVNSKERTVIQSRTHNFNDLLEKAEKSVEDKMLLIQECTKMYNHELLEKLLKELEEQNPTYTAGLCASLIKYYSNQDNIDEAEKWYNRLHEIQSDIQLDKSKILQYASLLIKKNRSSDALKVLEHPKLNTDLKIDQLCKKLLMDVSLHCPDQLEVFFNKLKDFGYIPEVTSASLKPIIEHYLSIGNIEMAVKKFEWAVETYKVTPYRAKLTEKLISIEDAKTLQHVTGLCTQIYGESNALFDLAVSFLECDRPKQARKILETAGFRLRQDRIIYIAKNYVQNKNVEMLEKFIQLISGLRCDVNPLYYDLLQLYEMENNWQKSLALWTQMQEDNIQPSVQFMNKLEDILRNNNQEIPFVKSSSTKNSDNNIENFRKALSNGNLSEAKECLQHIPKKVRSNYLLQLIDHYLDVENVDEALANLKEFWRMENKTFQPFQDTVTKALEKLKNSNDFQNILKVISDAKEFCKKFDRSSEFTYLVNKMYYESNKYGDLFEFMENSMKDKTEAEQVISLLFHSAICIQYLYDHPEFEERLSTFAKKASEYEIQSPTNSLWTYKFLNNSPDAESFFKNRVKQFLSLNAIYGCKQVGAWNKLPQLCKFIMEYPDIKLDLKRRQANILLLQIVNSDAPNKYDIAFQCMCEIVKVVPPSALNKNSVKKIEENYQDKEALQALYSNDNMKPRNQEAATG